MERAAAIPRKDGYAVVGATDAPKRGRSRRRCTSEPFDRIYSSDLARAAETARMLGESSGAEVVVDDRLQEFDFGRWEGLTWDEIVAANPHLAGLGSTAAKLYAPEGGESFAQVSRAWRRSSTNLHGRDL